MNLEAVKHYLKRVEDGDYQSELLNAFREVGYPESELEGLVEQMLQDIKGVVNNMNLEMMELNAAAFADYLSDCHSRE